jgi:predicted dinucleotide-binding enzyme
MTTPTQYSIIGSGNVGTALAQLFDRAGIEVSIANTRGPDSMADLVASLGPGVRAVAVQDALLSEVLLLAIPFMAIEQFGSSLPDWTGKTVVDTTNAYYATNSEALLRGRLSAHYTAEKLSGADVVKAFNQLPANTLANALDPQLGKRVVFRAADSAEAGNRVAALVDDLGLAAVQLGRIDEGGRLIQVPAALVLREFVERPQI